MNKLAEMQLRFYEELKSYDHCEYFERHLLYLAAPILRRAKASELIMLRRSSCINEWKKNKEYLCNRMGLTYFELNINESSAAILIYDKELLEKAVHTAKTKAILEKNDYPKEGSLQELLEHLSMRFQKDGFPHEIGLFLDYPPEDVESFIAYKGKNYLTVHYWKVYHNEHTAFEKCKCIDRAKVEAIKVLNKQDTAEKAVKHLKVS